MTSVGKFYDKIKNENDQFINSVLNFFNSLEKDIQEKGVTVKYF